MDPGIWHRYVAIACSQAWHLDVYDTEEVRRCIEALAAAAPAHPATIRVLLRTGVGEIAVDGQQVRIGFRTYA